MIFSIVFVVLGFVSMIKSESCLGQKEKSLISGIRSSLKTLEEKLEGWKEYKNHCYYFSSDTKTWPEAERKCRNKGGYLVQISGSSENSWVVTILTKAVQHQFGYWMGATNVKDGQWKWINDLSKVQYSNWIPGQPDNSKGVEDCASFWKDNNYNWNDVKSNHDGLGYICEKLV
ncbi:MRC [Mytilus coruscus]|uniref:MRC n=1 Tax=Mytilus coruscus TaxID=42192 RepID=A0A6J8E8Q7_MYTCO|nr:MRC [Mytilus coruscus]